MVGFTQAGWHEKGVLRHSEQSTGSVIAVVNETRGPLHQVGHCIVSYGMRSKNTLPLESLPLMRRALRFAPLIGFDFTLIAQYPVCQPIVYPAPGRKKAIDEAADHGVGRTL